MNTIQIEKIFEKYPTFKSVLAFDQLPTKIYPPAAYIINTHTSEKAGEHWLAINYTKTGSVEFFDSYGLGPKFYGLDSFLIKTSKKCFYNTIALQSKTSNFCGFYCVLFILSRLKKVSFYNFLKLFDKSSIKNDKQLENLIKNNFIQ